MGDLGPVQGWKTASKKVFFRKPKTSEVQNCFCPGSVCIDRYRQLWQ